jgi:hypothetical protein
MNNNNTLYATLTCRIRGFSKSNGIAMPDIALRIDGIISFLEVGKDICGYVDIAVFLYY